MSKESITLVAENGADDEALHVAARGDFCSWDVNLIAMAICIGNGSSVDHAIETGPERGAHAHGARLAGGVERVAGKRNRFEPFGGLAYGAHFGVGTGVKLLHDGVEGA